MRTKIMLFAAAAALYATGATAQIVNSPFADQTINGGIHTDNSTNNAGGAGGAATAVTGSISNDNRSAGGNASATGIGGIGNQFGGSATLVSPNTNTNTALGGAVVGSGNSAQGQDQGQLQGQQQGQTASSNQGQSQTSTLTSNDTQANSQSTTVGGQQASQTNGQTVTFNEAVQRRQVASAHAPVVVNVASCAIGGSVAGQGPGFGFALGGARIDKACDVRANAQILFQLGETEAAVQYLSAANPAVAEAVSLVRSRK